LKPPVSVEWPSRRRLKFWRGKGGCQKEEDSGGEHRPNIRNALAKNRRAAYPMLYEEDGPGRFSPLGLWGITYSLVLIS